MKLYPDSTEQKLGFDRLRERIAANVLSDLGAERLDALRPSSDADVVRGRLAEVGEMQEALRFDDRVPFTGIADVRDVIRAAAPQGSIVDPENLVALARVLAVARLMRAYFLDRRSKYPALWRLADPLVPVPDLEDRIGEVVDDQGGIRDDASDELRRIRRQIVRQQQALRASVLDALRSAVGKGYATEEQPTIRNGRMVIPVRAEAKRKVQGFVHDTSATGQTVYIEPASALDLNNEVRTLQLEEQREVQRILRAVADRVRVHLDALRLDLDILAHFDLLQAKARLGNRIDAVVPDLDEGSVLRLRGARNPVLALRFREEGEGERVVVPLDLDLGEAHRTLIVTGPNAGGKSVAMKTVGLLALMTAYGLPVPVGTGTRIGLFDRMLLDVGDEQSMEEDLSTFSSHVANLRFMLRHVDDRTLVLIDEAGTGTDPAEGGALAQAVLEALHDAGARTIVTTHHGTLKAFAHETEGVQNASMQFDQETLSPTYRFQPGIPGSSYAFEVAARIGLSADVLERARGLVGDKKTAFEDLVAEFESRTQALAEEQAAVERERRRHEHARASFEGRDRKLKEEADRIRTEALTEAERIIGQANARVERTIREIKEAQAERESTRQAREQLERFKQDLGSEQEQTVRRRSKRAARGKKTKPAAPEATASQAIAVGDQVVLDDGATAAEVLELDGDEAVIARESLRMRVEVDRLTRVGGRRAQQVSIRQTGDTSGVAALRARHRIDLRGKRVDEALAEVVRFLDEGIATGTDRLEIVHGKGTGALRAAIHEALARNPDVSEFDEAPVDQGGAGVTLVSLR